MNTSQQIAARNEELQDMPTPALIILARRNGFDPDAYRGRYAFKDLARDLARHEILSKA